VAASPEIPALATANFVCLNVDVDLFGCHAGEEYCFAVFLSRVYSTSNSQQNNHHNTRLTATNIHLNTPQDTKIKGANLQATNQLNMLLLVLESREMLPLKPPEFVPYTV
jgi:hypothetical protein